MLIVRQMNSSPLLSSLSSSTRPLDWMRSRLELKWPRPQTKRHTLLSFTAKWRTFDATVGRERDVALLCKHSLKSASSKDKESQIVMRSIGAETALIELSILKLPRETCCSEAPLFPLAS